MRLNVRHATRYSFDAPMRFVTQSHRLTPTRCAGQNVLAWSVSADGAAFGARFTDGDFDFDGAVDGDDLRALLLGFGKTQATFQPQGQMAAAVPEPAAFILVCVLLIGSASAHHGHS